MGAPLVFNIQKYAIHDGEGIRTTVFFKGCPLSCRWCHNPESQRWQRELMFHRDRCTGCGSCAAVCPEGAAQSGEGCAGCGICAGACVHGARELVGREYPLEELVRELEKDRMFYEQSGGGITLSGGEALAQDMDYMEELARRLCGRGYSVDFDTCGHVPYSHFQRVLPYADAFLYDLKLLDPADHRRYTGEDNRLILENLRRLSADGGKINLRLPLIKGVNASDAYIRQITAFLKAENIRVYRVNLLKYHETGRGKYEKLGKIYDQAGMAPPEDQWLERAADMFRQDGWTNIHIGG